MSPRDLPGETAIVLPVAAARWCALAARDRIRAEAIRVTARKWINGTTIRYGFLERPGWTWDAPQKAAMRAAFAAWQGLGIGLALCEVADAEMADLPIGHDLGDHSRCYVGTDVLRHRHNAVAMNLAVDLTTPQGRAMALQAVGHVLGLEHGDGHPAAAAGPFAPAPHDVAWARHWYPADLAARAITVGTAHRLPLEAGAQATFAFSPEASGFHQLRIRGTADAVMVLFEEQAAGGRRTLAAASDLGSLGNARIRHSLLRGGRYSVGVRIGHANPLAAPRLVID